MSSIPYNYGKYIDDKVSMTKQGHVGASKQIQSPASAGSRGLAKTTQFTNNPTQMQMGNSPIAESMVEIRNILNRIDGLNAPVQEDAGLTDQQKQGLKTVYEKYKNRKGYNGDVLPIGYLDYNVDTGIWFDGADEKEVEAAMKKLGHADMDAWEEAAEGEEYEQFLELAPITGQMIGDLSDVLGDNFTSNDALMKAALAYMNSIDESYEPFPEADEFDINEDEDFEEVLGPLGFPEDETELFDAEYRGRKVPLNKPMRGDVKKFKVYVKDPKTGNVKKVNFGHGGTSAKKLGQKTMKIRKSNPKARKSFRARHNCANPGPKTKARYWSCRKW